MPMKLLDTDAFRAAAKDGRTLDGTVFRFATTEPEQIGDDTARTQRFVFSDATVDHAGDSIDPKGWQLDVFKSNPVALFSHMSWDPPIGKASNVGVKDGKLVGDIEFAAPEVYEFADTIYRLVKGGYLKAVSVGFKPKEWAFTNDKARPFGIDFKKQLLLEISVCPVPCNPAALGEARSVGVDTSPLVEWAEKVLDSGDTVFLPRKELETLRTQAKGAEPPRYYLMAGRSLTDAEIEVAREAVKQMNDDPAAQPELPEGVEVRSTEKSGEDALIGAPLGNCGRDKDMQCGMTDPQECAVHATPVKSVATKAGRRVSAATKAKLQEAMDHHAAATKCVMEAMGGPDDPDPDGDQGDPDDGAAQDAIGATPQPPGTVVPDPDKDLTPEQRRLKEVRALRADLPKND